ncbi:MAG: hypothetical protein NC300_07860 [Bacteroidales bacterium]|nr:hypothetical protein [Clostridium sp.]MCM1204045.1 hypothetical protein [Bacteroidales bacterium]
MANKVVLPVKYPAITSWQWHATLFSILGEDENAKKWIYSNYIQLRCYNIAEYTTGDEILLCDMMPGSSSLKECPYLIFSLITKPQIESYCGDVIDFIVKTIDLGGYIYGAFDEARMISNVNVDYKFSHELFIYGYNLEEEIFYVGDFTFKDKYAYNTVTFDAVKRGFEVLSAGEDHVFKDDYKGTRGLYVIQRNTDNKYYDVDSILIKRTLEEYLKGEDTKDHFRMMRNRFDDTVFGVNVYDALQKRVDKQLHEEEPDFDIRALHIAYDHKVLMSDRLKYLMANEIIPFDQKMLDEYAEVVENMLAARNLLVRISVTGEIEAGERITDYLQKSKETETAILTKVVELL